MKGISLHSIVPVRAEAREGAEQNTQMLFGELCQITNHQSPITNWTHVRLENDGQEGWVDTKMICPMKTEEYEAYKDALKTAAMVAFPVAYAVSENNGQTIPLTAGTKITNYQSPLTNEASTARFEVLGVGFRIDPGMVITKTLDLNEQNLLQTVRFFLNTPYLWGGKNALGMDCSGFTQVILSLFGRQLFRNASEQATQGTPVASLSEAQAGDLAFFSKSPVTNDQSPIPITHVGIVIDPTRIVHCSGRVKVEKLDETGIFNIEKGDYSHHLVQIRRIAR
ncbi:MAG: C40 family peptidase [Paludibacteraceae bacterium]|nr:C40 family peptidase [Paludibacteraceae bacterium]